MTSWVAAHREELSTMEAAGAAPVPDLAEAPPETPEFERSPGGR